MGFHWDPEFRLVTGKRATAPTFSFREKRWKQSGLVPKARTQIGENVLKFSASSLKCISLTRSACREDVILSLGCSSCQVPVLSRASGIARQPASNGRTIRNSRSIRPFSGTGRSGRIGSVLPSCGLTPRNKLNIVCRELGRFAVWLPSVSLSPAASTESIGRRGGSSGRGRRSLRGRRFRRGRGWRRHIVQSAFQTMLGQAEWGLHMILRGGVATSWRADR